MQNEKLNNLKNQIEFEKSKISINLSFTLSVLVSYNISKKIQNKINIPINEEILIGIDRLFQIDNFEDKIIDKNTFNKTRNNFIKEVM